MLLHVLKSKLHEGVVTGCRMDYHGSLTTDVALMEAAGMVPYEMVWIFDITNGQRFQTYLIPGARGSKALEVNGAAARLVQEGDRIIVLASAMMTPEEAAEFHPTVLLLDEHNTIVRRVQSGPARPIQPEDTGMNL